MIIRNSKFKQVIPDNFTYKGTKYTKAYHKGEILFAYTDDDYAYQYFTIESLEDGNVITFSIPAAITTSELTSMSYSSDGGSTWNTTTVDGTAKTISVNLDKGSKVLWKGIGTRTSTSSSSCSFSSTKTYNTYGNLKSLLLNDNFYNNTTSTSTTNKYRNLFKNSTGLVDAHNLMIDNTFGNYQYYGFFRGCSNLVYSPKLSSESLTVQCYQEMFAYCSSLVEAPELPATTLKANCYREMFYGCTSLVKVPELPATTMVTGCYLGMFYNCSGLIEAPELPATTLNEGCYQGMFQNCTSLVIPPELPATTLNNYCYKNMFNGCTSLAVVPGLPALTLALECYREMFRGCTSLVEAPDLPATTAANNCYYAMFMDCTLLVKAPALLITTLATGCYAYMFRNCTSLNYIKCLATDISASNCTQNWVQNVAATGTFIKADNMSSWVIDSVNGIPIGWTLYITDYSQEYFTILSQEDSNVITLTIGSDVTSTQMTSFSYSVDNGSTWNTTNVNSTTQTINVSLDKGEKVIWKGVGNTTSVAGNASGSSVFSSTKKHVVYGNIMSLLFGDNFINETSLANKSTRTFGNLFNNNTNIVEAHNLALPATTLQNNCYQIMFEGCTSLTTAPKLPATTTAQYCYQRMFRNTALVEAPELPATTLSTRCYYDMFFGCTSLTTSPDLPNATLANQCCQEMFYGCNSLAKAPKLPSTTLAAECYRDMFLGCTSLVEAPELLAQTLTSGCYRGMFNSCSSLNYIKCLATDISASNCTTGWVSYVAATGTFIKADNMSSWVIDSVNGIPIGWTLHNYENCTVTLTVNDPSYGRVDGAGTYHTGELVTIKANAIDGYRFVGWYNGNTLVSENEAYTFQIWTDVSYQAMFESGQVDYSTQYFTLESLEDDNPITLHHGQYAKAPVTVEYSLNNGASWASFTYKSNIGNEIQLNLNKGDKVLVKSSNLGYNSNSIANLANTNSFFASKAFKAYGNAMSLIYSDDFANQTTIPFWGALAGIFITSDNLNDASNLVLPATNISPYCYYCMFFGCTSLKKGPSLPATGLDSYCYKGMFAYCKSLTEAPALPSTGMKLGCYYTMFRGCTSLVTPPALRAENLRDADGCYKGMFYGCSSLASAPALPATVLAIDCYQSMFENCTSLTTAPALPSETLLAFCYKAMFWGCSKLAGTFILPALTVDEKSYDKMFTGTKINTIKVYAPSSSWAVDFGSSLPSSGTYYVKRNATGNITVALPSGWRISKTL